MAVAVILFELLFAGTPWEFHVNVDGGVTQSIDEIIKDPEGQWVIVFCLLSYLALFLSLRHVGHQRVSGIVGWLLGAVALNATVYFNNYCPSIDAVVLIAGVFAGQAFAVWVRSTRPLRCAQLGRPSSASIILILLILLTAASLCDSSMGSLTYYNRQRWTGPWANPNIGGLLIGSGLVLLVAFSVIEFTHKHRPSVLFVGGRKITLMRCVPVVLSLLGFVVLGLRLLQSYSRGAWIATLLGFVYLIIEFEQHTEKRLHASWILGLMNKRTSLTLIVCSAIVICFWWSQKTEWLSVRRALSSASSVDFSSRNRIAAWEGAFQIISEYPYLGTGWSLPAPLYENYYIPAKLAEGGTIQLNNYLILGASLGIPALSCFGMYFWKSLTQKSIATVQDLRIKGCELIATETGGSMDRSKTACRAGAIVLLAGFWFDGGLFRLATASTFWILLEIGCTD